MSENNNPYICEMCNDAFYLPGWGHCPKCDHHYEIGTLCANCKDMIIPETMRQLGISWEDWYRITDAARNRERRKVDAYVEKLNALEVAVLDVIRLVAREQPEFEPIRSVLEGESFWFPVGKLRAKNKPPTEDDK